MRIMKCQSIECPVNPNEQLKACSTIRNPSLLPYVTVQI
jgi:hypothetical protein